MLKVDALALRRADRLLFSALEFSAAPRQRVGIVGPNGCGKTSLFAALLGELEPDAGSIERPTGWRIALAAQESPSGSQSSIDFVIGGDAAISRAHTALRAAEAAGDGEAQASLHRELDHAGGYDYEARAGALLDGLGFSGADQQRALDTFSGGWRARLALARSLFARPDVLLLDEPTNHLDLPTIDWLEQWCISYPGIILCVSHDRDFLDRIATHVLWIDRPAPRFFKGNLSVAESRRAQILSIEAGERQRNVRRAAELQRFVDRFRAKATKARQAQSRLKMLERLEITAPISEYAGYAFEFPPPAQLESPLLTLDHADLGYGDTVVVRDVHLSILPGDRIGVVGRNGSGKSTLIRALAGRLDVASRYPAAALRVGYFAQHQLDQLDAEASPLAHLRRLDPDIGEQRLRDYLGRFGFHGDDALEPIAPRSGGEKARLALALLAWKRPNLLLLDEPTNHLDLQMRDALSIALQDYAGAVIVVAHDRAFLRALCDDWLRVAEGRIERCASLEEATEPTPAASDNRSSGGGDDRRERRRAAAEERARRKPLTDRVAHIEREMDKAGARLAHVREQLADPALYENGAGQSVAALSSEAGELQARIDDLESQWLEAHEALEAMS